MKPSEYLRNLDPSRAVLKTTASLTDTILPEEHMRARQCGVPAEINLDLGGVNQRSA